MISRKIPFINGYFYHIFNRSIDNQLIFQDKRDIKRFLLTVNYYRFQNLPMRYSYFINLMPDEREKILKELKRKNEILVEILTYAIMPNHYHFLVRQVKEDGISRFIGNLQNSFARYFNIKSKRSGHLFEGKFKAVLVEREEQLIHLARYIELNPLTSMLVKDFEELKDDFRVSLEEYLNNDDGICEKKYILAHFKTINRYFSFLKDQIDYQRRLNRIKHLVIEKRIF